MPFMTVMLLLTFH